METIIKGFRYIKLYGTDNDKKYYISCLQKNSTAYVIYISEENTIPHIVCSFYMEKYIPMKKIDKISFSENNNSGISGFALIDWSEYGDNFYIDSDSYDKTGLSFEQYRNNIDSIMNKDIENKSISLMKVDDTVGANIYPFNKNCKFGSYDIKYGKMLTKAIKNIILYTHKQEWEYYISIFQKNADAYVITISSPNKIDDKRVCVFNKPKYVPPTGIDIITLDQIGGTAMSAKIWIDWSEIVGNAYLLWKPEDTKLDARTYINQDQIIKLESRIKVLEQVSGDSSVKWSNKRWISMGDSITNYGIYQNAVKNLLGIGTVDNFGVNGSTISAYQTTLNPMCLRVDTLPSNADVITVFGGTNDFGNLGGTPLGQLGDTDNKTFYGGVYDLITKLIIKYPNKKIGFITPLHRNNNNNNMLYKDGLKPNSLGFKLEQYAKAIKEVCSMFSIPVLDLYETGGINELNVTVKTRDGLHPTDYELAETIATQIAKFIDSI